ncbi:hypothetical protein [Haloplanus pelagicus]|jgi:hypothetical protein|uniref:hypothetical protein n=1 Tax=Haloplanus pelagicus TaxID=2949995 RepID=UPI00203CFC79|nr:hypothetical protein [Haloplanus sp. HW8-1]
MAESVATEGESVDPLLAWSLSAFHAATLTAGPVLVLHAIGALDSLLQGIHTVTGLSLYAALWLVTWRTNRRWLAAADCRTLRGTAVPGATWGAVTGVAFLVVLLVVIGVAVRELLLVAAFALVGTPVAALSGAVIGAGAAALDLLILAAGRRLAGVEGPVEARAG